MAKIRDIEEVKETIKEIESAVLVIKLIDILIH